jgi:phage terminase large subunit-like protein
VARAERVDQALLENKLAGIRALQEQLHRLKFQKFDGMFPDEGPLRRELYPKALDFFKAGAEYKERCLMGGNRTGKTETGAYEATAHATGRYPKWWEGREFHLPTSGVACGKSGKVLRDTVQVKLVGFPAGPMGSGMIPADSLILDDCKRAGGTADLLDVIAVKHVNGGKSIINLKSYDQGREAFEGTGRDWVWEDEEADTAIHGENMARTMTTNGIVWNTYTPLKGQTALTMDLTNRSQGASPSVYLVRITWDDAAHITAAMMEAMESIYKPHEMKARRWGIPKMGSGAIYTMDWDEVSVPPRAIEPYWTRCYGLDFGWTHPTAALWLAHDRDNNVTYAYSEHRRAEARPGEHAIAIKARGEWIRGASETAGGNPENGKRMIDIYRGLGLHLVPAEKAVWPGIESIREALTTGRLKFFRTLHLLREEYEGYQTDEKGKIVKERDDLLDCLRYGWNAHKQIGRVQPPKRRPGSGVKAVKFSERKLF